MTTDNSKDRSTAKKVVLISCAKSKQRQAAPAGQLYTSALFQKSLDYARLLNPDAIYVLSAKYGLVGIDDIIAPYELTLNRMPRRDVEAWSHHVLQRLAELTDPARDHFIILAGKQYYRYLLPALKHVELPLKGLALGQRLSWLSSRQAPAPHASCADLHRILATQPRFRFPFGKRGLPGNGIYVLFERGETAHDTDRIVRIGTHRGPGQLAGRLREHFINENKDRSIFRKNTGRALLHRDKDSRINQWEIDLTSRQARQRHTVNVDGEFIKSLEIKVSEYIRANFSFMAIPVSDKDTRMRFEAGLIATVANCPGCGPSKNWLGLHSPKEPIRSSGLWLVQGLNALPLSADETRRLLDMLGAHHKPDTDTKARSEAPPTTKAKPEDARRSGSTYQPLSDYLLHAGKRELMLRFQDIERIIGKALPTSARKYQAWWSNQRDTSNHSHAKAWMRVGYRSQLIELGENGLVRFTRDTRET